MKPLDRALQILSLMLLATILIWLSQAAERENRLITSLPRVPSTLVVYRSGLRDDEVRQVKAMLEQYRLLAEAREGRLPGFREVGR